ncbi:DUF2971 domain-containing protein [Vibrio jasicida]|uniref:DUF2971 domain-containing protein n=1 Tax=Vibrio jasicida TaxID=766224 RepID=UPI0040684A0A
MKFLSNGLIRLTQSECLNDPFELRLTDHTSSKLDYSVTMTDGCKEIIHGSIGVTGVMSQLGVVSLTESKDNLLMWSHYADSHKGIVIEFEINMSNPYDLFLLSDDISITSNATFDRVQYKKTRWLDEQCDTGYHDVLKHYILTKSDEWIYEKEHRFVLPFSFSSDILISKEFFERHCSHLSDLLIGSDDSAVKHLNLNSNEVIHEKMSFWINNDLMMLRVRPSSVTGVYIGSNCCEAEFRNEIVENEYKFLNETNCSLYKCYPDKSRFELNYRKF